MQNKLSFLSSNVWSLLHGADVENEFYYSRYKKLTSENAKLNFPRICIPVFEQTKIENVGPIIIPIFAAKN